ncbi:protein IQ-DOMAIN 19-like [Pyrus communis]|uniref:protein IQ-DOMAIN 19-like n=1 Tax=Pyrus communis TaxID=23211 RepID=UPI0035C07098
MGKASRWIINFLVGKQEKKINDVPKTNVSNEFLLTISARAEVKHPGTPKVKRRWSFGKLAGKEASHMFTKSVDSIDITKLPLKAQKNRAVTPRDVENAAATRIQAAFRSHLARKALHALKGLVKLQALIRGHIVRKQTTATLIQMQALMAIQVRARIKRIQMAEEARLANKKQLIIQRGHPQDNGVHRASLLQSEMFPNSIDLNPNDVQRVAKSTSGHLNHSQGAGRFEHGHSKIYSDRLSISNRHHYEDFSFATANSPWNYPSASKPKPTRHPFTHQDQDYTDDENSAFKPNYMTNTKSSKAKARSQSEPKQRPEASLKNRSKQTEVDATLVAMDYQVLKRSSTEFKPDGQKNQDPWFVKLYRSRRLFEDNKHASGSPSTVHSYYHESLAAYEPHVNLY